MKKLTLAALGIIALASLPVSAADWSDTFLGYRTGSKFQETAVPDAIKKDIYSLQHVSGFSMGTNFFNVDMLKSDLKDPANTSSPGTSRGAQEVYVAYRNNLSLSKLFGAKMSNSIIRDAEFTTGFDYNSKNTTFAPSVFKIMAGPTVAFQVPGFFTLGVLYYNEKNHNAFGGFDATKGGGLNVSFDPTYQVAAAWGINVPLGKVDTKVKGFGTYTGAKGKDGGGVKTVPETLIDIYWMFDISPVLGAKKGTWQIGPGYEYWDAKFGDPTYKTQAAANAASPAGIFTQVNPQVNCFMLALEYHF
jgi:nucleoside-specific outer membrane channel protein Tsx